VQAGLPLAALDALLARHGQCLPVAGAAGAGLVGAGTVGGLLATGADGACDLASGRARDRLLGGAVALPDGSVAHGRGRVVKNVAGYDLPRLLCGGHDSLGVLVEATFKLEPRPARRGGCRAEFGARGLAFAAARAVLDSGLEPDFLDVLEGGESGQGAAPVALATGFRGSDARVQGQLAALSDLLAPHEPLAVSALSADALDALLARLDDPARHAHGERGERVVLRLAVLPDALQALCDDAAASASRHECALTLDGRPGAGLLLASLAGEAEALAAAARALLGCCRQHGAARALAATPGARARLGVADLWGPPPPELFLLERVKAACDPDGVLGVAWPAGSD